MKRVVAAWAIAVLVLPAGARAQTMGVAPTPGIRFTPPPQPPAASAASSPAPARGHTPRGHGQPHDGWQGTTAGGDLFLAHPDTYKPRPWPKRLSPTYALPGYFVGAYAPLSPTVVHHEPEPELAGGYLRLQIEPRTAQVYVDGFFVGTIAELPTARVALEPGPHRVEVRADGFEPLAFDVRIRPHETVTYTRELPRASAAPPTPAAVVASTAPASPRTLYVIPRCYAGSKPPVASALPAGCRIADVRRLQ